MLDKAYEGEQHWRLGIHRESITQSFVGTGDCAHMETRFVVNCNRPVASMRNVKTQPASVTLRSQMDFSGRRIDWSKQDNQIDVKANGGVESPTTIGTMIILQDRKNIPSCSLSSVKQASRGNAMGRLTLVAAMYSYD